MYSGFKVIEDCRLTIDIEYETTGLRLIKETVLQVIKIHYFIYMCVLGQTIYLSLMTC